MKFLRGNHSSGITMDPQHPPGGTSGETEARRTGGLAKDPRVSPAMHPRETGQSTQMTMSLPDIFPELSYQVESEELSLELPAQNPFC